MARFIYPGVRGEPIQQKPGIYQGVPFEEYLAWNAISNSSLSPAVSEVAPLLISMAHYKKQLPLTPTQAFKFGKLTHASKFEFANALRDYVVMPEFRTYREAEDGTLIEDPCKNDDGKTISKTPANTKDYKRRVQAFTEKNVGKIIVSNTEIENLAGVLNALDQNEIVRRLYANNGPATDYELSIVWQDEQTGLMCKGRLDCVQHSEKIIPDLKTSQRVADFEKALGIYGYHRQGAYYADGMKVLTGATYTPWCVAAEPEGPVFGVRAKPIGQATFLAGRWQYRQLLDRIAVCIKSARWPEFEEVVPVPDWEIPHWQMPAVA